MKYSVVYLINLVFGTFPSQRKPTFNEMEKRKEKAKVRLRPLESSKTIQPSIDKFWDESSRASNCDSGSTDAESGSSSVKTRPSAWQSPLTKEHWQDNTKATNEAASSEDKPNTAKTSESLHQDPGVLESTTSKPVEKRGKNYAKNQRRKERKRMYLGMQNLLMRSPVQGQDIPSSSGVNKRARGSSSTQSNTSTSLPQKRGRVDTGLTQQEGISKSAVGGSSSLTYAEVAKTSNQKLVITRKESEGDSTMDGSDLREIQKAITQMILHTDPGFLVRIERTFLHEGRVLMICADEKTLNWAKEVVRAIEPSLDNHQGYDAMGPKDLPPAKTFGIWIPEEEGVLITDILAMVDRCNSELHRKDMELKHTAKGAGGLLHIVAVREPSLTGLKELKFSPYAGYRRVEFQKRKPNLKKSQQPNDSLSCVQKAVEETTNTVSKDPVDTVVVMEAVEEPVSTGTEITHS